MAEVQKISVALTGEQIAALKSAVASGEYATTSEVVREAIRDWQHKRAVRQGELNGLRRAGAGTGETENEVQGRD